MVFLSTQITGEKQSNDWLLRDTVPTPLIFGAAGYSSKPPRDSDVAKLVNGELGRFTNEYPDVWRNGQLGSACGTKTRIVDVDLSHPLKSPYNFYTSG
jgi:hypothetical protein